MSEEQIFIKYKSQKAGEHSITRNNVYKNI